MSEQDRADAAAAARAKAAKAKAAKAKAARERAAKQKAAKVKAAAAAKAKAAAAKAKAAKTPRVETLGVTSPAAAASTSKAPVVAANAGDGSQLSKTILLGLFGLAGLLFVASLLPLNYEFVPYRFAVAWHDRRVAMAVMACSLLVLGAIFYALLHL